jgi:ribosomal protein S18 acetylase RimI-like enzyme
MTYQRQEPAIRALLIDLDREALTLLLSDEDGEALARLVPLIQHKYALCFVAQQGEQLLGWAVMHIRFRAEYGWQPDPYSERFQTDGNAYVEFLEVFGTHKGEGLGARLLRHLEQEARRSQIHTLWLHVRESNTRAVRFYEREGWKYQFSTCPPWCKGRPMKIYQRNLT